MITFAALLSPWSWLLVLGIALLILGPGKLPDVGKGLGRAIRGFKEEINSEEKKGETQK